jgi:hypothetical protein
MSTPIPQCDIDGVNYQHHPDHRNGNTKKSQWTISEPAERESFRQAGVREWLSVDRGWGLHTPNERPEVLGESQDRERKLFVAKFVASAAPVVWHGYPADHQRHPQDVPESRILSAWESSGLLAAAKITKLLKGKPCSL